MSGGDRGQHAPEVDGEPAAERFEWPSFFETGVAEVLVGRVFEAAGDQRERRLFASILRRAREDLFELEILYRELPGVLAGDRAATKHFQQVLDDAFARGLAVEPSPFVIREADGFTPNPEMNPSDPPFVVRRSRIRLLSLGIAEVTRGNGHLRESYVNTLRGLWGRAHLLERFYRQAIESDERGRDRLAEDLRIIARDLEAIWPLPEPLPPSLAPSAGMGRPFPEDGPSPWPGPDDGPPLPWPPGSPEPGGRTPGGPGLPPGLPPGRPPGRRPPGRPLDLSRFFDDPCTHFALGQRRFPAPDLVDDAVGVCGPHEGPWAFVGLREEAVNGRSEVDDPAEDAAPELLIGQLG